MHANEAKESENDDERRKRNEGRSNENWLHTLASFAKEEDGKIKKRNNIKKKREKKKYQRTGEQSGSDATEYIIDSFLRIRPPLKRRFSSSLHIP